MKWFKMQSDNLDDPFIQDLINEFGGTGYLAYFGIVTLICRENKKELTGKAEFSQTFLKQKLHVSPGKLQEILRFCEGKGKLFFTFSEKNFKLDFPKILEIKDNYTKDLQGARKKPSKHTDKETDTDKEEEGDTPPPRKNYEDVNRDPREKIDTTPCLVHYQSEYQRILKNLPSVAPLKAHEVLLPIMKERGTEETNRLITEFLEYQEDGLIIKRGWPLYLLPNTINALLAMRTRAREPTYEEKEAEFQRLLQEDIDKHEREQKETA
jgi:Lin1244/Lin1753-like, N-terminal